MQYTVTREKGSVTFKFSTDEAEWDQEIDAVYRKKAKQINIPGFRKGQAPRRVIERYYGEGVFFEDAFDEYVRKCYGQAMREHEDIYPVDSPSLDVVSFPESGTPLVFTMKVTTYPEVALGAYTGIKTERVAYNVEEKDVAAELERAQKTVGRKITVSDRAVFEGDEIELDYSGTVDGVLFDGGTATNQTLIIGSHSFIPGFEEQLIGLKTGEERDIGVTFPMDYHAEELKGKEAVFHVRINEIHFTELPALDDEFARDTTKFDTLAEYKDDIFARLSKDAHKRAENEMRAKIIELVVGDAQVDIPECMITEELDGIVEEFAGRLQSVYPGFKVEDYFKHSGSSVEAFKAEHRAQAEKDVKTRLVMREIIKRKELGATQSEADAEVKRLADAAGQEVSAYKRILTKESIGKIYNDVTLGKLFEFLLANNTFE
ncbi:MAG: trigger factor [Firmicutes bacterium]|nr:trigger factor [Bacillota bacterium]